MTAMKTLWEVSVQSAFIIAVILLLRVILKNKISPAAQYALWLLPLIRLIFPFSVSSIFSIMNIFEPMTRQLDDAVSNSMPPAASGSPAMAGGNANQAMLAVHPFNMLTLLFWVWIAGIAVVAICAIYANCRFAAINKRSRVPVQIPDSCKGLLAGMKRPPAVYIGKAAPSPCLCGLFNPYILLNEKSANQEAALQMVLAHELAHYRKGDHIFALLRCIVCAVYWFNPLVWCAASMSRQDCEIACDARVIKDFTKQQRACYGLALISIIERRPSMNSLLRGATSMTAGKNEMKRRIVQIANRPKMLRITALGLVLVVVVISLLACTGAVANGTPRETNSKAKASEEFARQIELNDAGNLVGLLEGLIQKYSLTTRKLALMGFDGNTITLDEIEENWKDGVDKQMEPYSNAVEKEEVFEFAPDDDGLYPAYMWYPNMYRDTRDTLGQMTAQDLKGHAQDAVDYSDVYTCCFDNGKLVLMIEVYMQ